MYTTFCGTRNLFNFFFFGGGGDFLDCFTLLCKINLDMLLILDKDIMLNKVIQIVWHKFS